jgi:MFS family permease
MVGGIPITPHVSDLSPLPLRGRYQGALGAAAGLGSGIRPPLGGLALDILPEPVPWLLMTAGGTVSAAAMLWLSRRGRTIPSVRPAVHASPE